jgi:hypothetical protein
MRKLAPLVTSGVPQRDDRVLLSINDQHNHTIALIQGLFSSADICVSHLSDGMAYILHHHLLSSMRSAPVIVVRAEMTGATTTATGKR